MGLGPECVQDGTLIFLPAQVKGGRQEGKRNCSNININININIGALNSIKVMLLSDWLEDVR